MIFESLRDNIILPKIGLGTARIGGRIIPQRWRDAYYLATLRSALELGYTHIDTAELYALGHSEELIGRAIVDQHASREDLIITTKVWPIHLGFDSLIRACENSLRRLQMEYLDLYLVHIPNYFIPLKETFRALNRLVQQGKVRQIGVSNFNLSLLQEAQRISEAPIITNQISYSLFDQTLPKSEMVGYCQKNDIIVTAYTPLRNKGLMPNATVQSIAQAHGVSAHQIALAWLIAQPRVITIPMSFNAQHQKENLESIYIKFSEMETKELNELGK